MTNTTIRSMYWTRSCSPRRSMLLTAVILAACGSDGQQATGDEVSIAECSNCMTDLRVCMNREDACASDRDDCTAAYTTCEEGYDECTTDLQMCEEERDTCADDFETCANERDACAQEEDACSIARTACEEVRDSCAADLQTRTTERDTRTAERDACTTEWNACVIARMVCEEVAGECVTDLQTCEEERDTCTAARTVCEGDRDSCATDLQTRTTERDACATARDACETARTACTTNLGTRTTERDACISERNVCVTERNACVTARDACVAARTVCEEDLEAFEDNRYRDTGTVSSLDLFSSMCSASNSDRILPDGNLGVFQDSKFGGQSQVWWRVNRSCAVGPTGSGCCLELNYRFTARRTPTYTPYAGVLTHFTYIPYGPIDVSSYVGLGMLARAEPTTGSTPRVSVQLADIGPNTSAEASSSSCRDGFFEAPLFEYGAAPSAFATVDVNFTDFRRPSWYGCTRATPLQTTRIYKLAIVLLNTSTTETALEGKVVFSNLHFR